MSKQQLETEIADLLRLMWDCSNKDDVVPIEGYNEQYCATVTKLIALCPTQISREELTECMSQYQEQYKLLMDQLHEQHSQLQKSFKATRQLRNYQLS